MLLDQDHLTLTEDVEADPCPGGEADAVLGGALVDAAVVPTHPAHPQRQARLIHNLLGKYSYE